MHSAEIRRRFLEYFEGHGHAIRSSSSLVPTDDPTLLFTNAGMVQFKKVFLGLENPTFGRRATTSQKCVRAGGKHNDLEQVGHTARHHTFFEMLGNFSFGDYFKRDAIRFAWEFITEELRLDPRHIRVSVFEEDEEARVLWREIAGLPDSRIYGLGPHDNFWQMADTGPCGPCSEIFIDLAHVATDFRFPEREIREWTEIDREEFSLPAFVEGSEGGRFLEIWNLVFMQFDRQADGTLVPLPKPSVDTGMGLDRTAAAMQSVTSNYHTDLFEPLIETIERTIGLEYRGRVTDAAEWQRVSSRSRAQQSAAVKNGKIFVEPAAFRVLADHARAVAFLLADGVFPSNEGRGYVLRRILRRAVRHAWLLGRATATLVDVTASVIDLMGDIYPELRARRTHIIDTTRAEEQRFLATIDAGMRRFDELAPASTTQGSGAVKGTIAGEDAFRLYDTYGFPLDLTELMARERGYTVDIAGFEMALAAQRTQSQQERKSRQVVSGSGSISLSGIVMSGTGSVKSSEFVGYDQTDVDTEAIEVLDLGQERFAVVLKANPFYAQSGGQISDRGKITGENWELDVDDVQRTDEGMVVAGKATGPVASGHVHATVPRDVRLDTERNHTATHLLHAALRRILGDHVHQAGSLVAPDRLRFDFTHYGPLTVEQIDAVTEEVNRGVLSATPLDIQQRAYADAVASGAMALFGEKYSDVVRVVSIPGVSAELCGGTHVRNTGEIGLFRIVSETGVAAGVRRIEAVTGSRAYELAKKEERSLREIEALLKVSAGAAPKRVQSLVEERRALEKRLDEAMRSGGSGEIDRLLSQAQTVDGARVVASEVSAQDSRELTSLGDALRDRLESGVAILAASFADGKSSLLGIVSDDLRQRGVRADEIIREVAAVAGGRGGGKPHMAQAGVPDASRIPDALAAVPGVVRAHLSRN